MVLENFGSGLQELTFEQASDINGGESLWYWIAYGVGAVAHAIYELPGSLQPSDGIPYPPR